MRRLPQGRTRERLVGCRAWARFYDTMWVCNSGGVQRIPSRFCGARDTGNLVPVQKYAARDFFYYCLRPPQHAGVIIQVFSISMGVKFLGFQVFAGGVGLCNINISEAKWPNITSHGSEISDISEFHG